MHHYRRAGGLLATTALSAVLLSGCAWSSQPMSSGDGSSGTTSAAPNAGSGTQSFGACNASPALQAACKTATDFGTYDYRTFKIPGWPFLNDLTASYRNSYISESAGYPAYIVANKAASRATVTGAMTRQVNATTSAAQVKVSLHTTGSGTPGNPTLTLAFILLKQANGTWLVDFMTTVK